MSATHVNDDAKYGGAVVIGAVVYQVVGMWDITSLGSVQVVGFFDVAARLCTGDGPIEELVGTVRSFLCCNERIQVTFPSSILSDYVHIKGR